MADNQPTLFDIEHWLPIVGWEEYYEVSDHGRVRSLPRVIIRADGAVVGRRGRIMRLELSNKGYQRVNLRQGNRNKRLSVHRLVLEAFVGPCPPGMEACHNDGNSVNNHVANLRWGTRGENTRDQVLHGRHINARKTHCRRNHPLKFPNLMARQAENGERRCLACARANAWVHKYPHLKPNRQEVSDSYYSKIMSEVA